MTYVHIDTPFESCKSCAHMEIEKKTYYNYEEPVDASFWCTHRKLCENAVEVYKRDQYQKQEEDE